MNQARRLGLSEGEIVDLTRDDAPESAAAWVRLRKAGRAKVSLADRLILATARRVGATLVTSDTDLRREAGVSGAT